MTHLSVSGVCARYGRKQVLFDVTLPDLEDGHFIGILGPNGSGKSTLIRCLSRELSCQGSIVLDGVSLASQSSRALWEKVATMPQSPPAPSALFPMELLWSICRALGMALSDRALSQRIEEVLALLGLDDQALAPLSTLSGGQRQRVGLALCLIRDPDLLLLDEPTAALDLHWRLTVLELIRRRLAHRGGVVIANLHEVDLAARYCDGVVVLGHGKVVAAGPPAEVLTKEVFARVYHVEAELHPGTDNRPSLELIRPLSSQHRPKHDSDPSGS